MADQGQRTEKPTKRRLEKSRKEGKFAVSREFVSSVHFLVFAWLLAEWSGRLFDQTRAFTMVTFEHAFHAELTRGEVVQLYREVLFTLLVPILIAGTALMAVTLAAQLGMTQLGFALEKLAPDFKRLNPMQKLKQMPQQGMASMVQAALLLPLFGYVVYRIAKENFAAYLSLAGVSVGPAIQLVSASYRSFIWKAGLILFLFGTVDFARQMKRHSASLKMSKQEIREEGKETEGNPQIKQRIRRIQRDLARRSMMKEVPKATAVIVNPTHYAVAIRYEMEAMAAPRVVAKGKNYLARRIREIANEHQVPIVENQPLAQALYKATDVGQEIPPQLYRAVAEILAYLFKLMNQGRR